MVTDLSKEGVASSRVKYTHLTLKIEGKASKMMCSAMFKSEDDYDNFITSVVM